MRLPSFKPGPMAALSALHLEFAFLRFQRQSHSETLASGKLAAADLMPLPRSVGKESGNPPASPELILPRRERPERLRVAPIDGQSAAGCPVGLRSIPR